MGVVDCLVDVTDPIPGWSADGSVLRERVDLGMSMIAPAEYSASGTIRGVNTLD